MSKHGEAEFWKQKADRLQKQVYEEIRRANNLQYMVMLNRQRECGCKPSGEACGDECSCNSIMRQDIESVNKLKGI